MAEINLLNMFNWSVQVCDSPNYGYSQEYRNLQTVGSVTYVDCSSFVWYALVNGGFDCKKANNGDDYPFITATMPTVLPKLGFKKVDINGEWKECDICLKEGHTELVYFPKGTGAGVCMGAHTQNAILANQVSIGDSSGNRDAIKTASDWETLWRYEGSTPVVTEWIYGTTTEYFTREKMENNAVCIYNFFNNEGWTLQAIAALCGNVEQESTFNPCLIEIGGTGKGLVQWTPGSVLDNAIKELYGKQLDWKDGDLQCSIIIAEYKKYTGGLPGVDIDQQWYETDEYPMAWYDWIKSTEDPGYLAMVFQANYLRPAILHPERQEMARDWYDFLQNYSPTPPTPPAKKKRKGLKIWQMIRRF